jgi:hypothetical protein
MGVPGKVRRAVTEDELRRIDQGIDGYFRLKERYLADIRAAQGMDRAGNR